MLQPNTPLLPVIDTNTITPTMELVKLQLGDKPENFDYTSYDIAAKIIAAIKDGVIEPLDFAVRRKLIVDAMDIAMKDPDVKKTMIDKVDSYGKQEVTALGARITITSRPIYKYEFDSKWAALKASIQPTLDAMKEQEERIKAACKNNGSIIDEESGEVIASIVPFPTTESIAVSFSKKKK